MICECAALPRLVLLILLAVSSPLSVPSAGASSTCSDLSDLRRRISLSLSSTTGRPTEHLSSLRGVVDNVLSRSECESFVRLLRPHHFVSGGGYDSDKNARYNAPVGYAGLGLKELSSDSHGGILTPEEYARLLEWREKARLAAEKALGVCPGTLRVDFTTISQKTPGGKHRPHADNSFHKFIPVPGDPTRTMVAVDPSRGAHPYPNRVAASILYLNDYGYDGGEFYFADPADGEPEELVQPKAGRMAVFTAGIENLHGALPVREPASEECDSGDDVNGECVPARRLALAMWYVPDQKDEEAVPSYGSQSSSAEEEDPSRTKVFEIPVRSMKRGGLRLALSLYLLGKQDAPSQGSWKFIGNQEQDGIDLGMLFQDGTGMISVSLRENAIAVGRHTDGPDKRPSLRYMLQESVLLHDILDELHSLAFENEEGGDEVKEDDRLVTFEEGTRGGAIEEARGALSARRA